MVNELTPIDDPLAQDLLNIRSRMAMFRINKSANQLKSSASAAKTVLNSEFTAKPVQGSQAISFTTAPSVSQNLRDALSAGLSQYQPTPYESIRQFSFASAQIASQVAGLGKTIPTTAEIVRAEIRALARAIESSSTVENDHITRAQSTFKKIKSLPQTEEGMAVRQTFIETFSQDIPGFNKVREAIGQEVYVCVECPNPNQPWHTTSKSDFKAKYFHATEEENVVSILTQEELKVKHGGAYKGAFVSTKPERDYGRYVIGLNDKIELAQPIDHLFCNADARKRMTCWIGFSKSIPINSETFEFIAIENPAKGEIERLQKQLSSLTHDPIKIIDLKDVDQSLMKKKTLEGIAIPKEWFENKWGI